MLLDALLKHDLIKEFEKYLKHIHQSKYIIMGLVEIDDNVIKREGIVKFVKTRATNIRVCTTLAHQIWALMFINLNALPLNKFNHCAKLYTLSNNEQK